MLENTIYNLGREYKFSEKKYCINITPFNKNNDRREYEWSLVTGITTDDAAREF